MSGHMWHQLVAAERREDSNNGRTVLKTSAPKTQLVLSLSLSLSQSQLPLIMPLLIVDSTAGHNSVALCICVLSRLPANLPLFLCRELLRHLQFASIPLVFYSFSVKEWKQVPMNTTLEVHHGEKKKITIISQRPVKSLETRPFYCWCTSNKRSF